MKRNFFKLTLGLLLWLAVGAERVDSLTFEDWQAEHFTAAELADEAVSGAGANPAGDGLGNLLKYAFALDPHAPALAGAPVAQFYAGALALNFLHRSDVSDLGYALEASADLTHWSLRNTFEPSATLAMDNVVTQWTVADPYLWPAGAVQFLRLRVVRGGTFLNLIDPPDHVTARTVAAPFGVEVRWSDRSNVELGYRVDRQRVADGVWDLFGITGQDTMSYLDHTAHSGTAYNYRVRAMFADGSFSGWSESGGVTPTASGGSGGSGGTGGGSPDPDPDTDNDTYKDSLDLYPHDRRRSRDLPTLTYAEIDLSTPLIGAKDVTLIALGDQNQVAFSYYESNSPYDPEGPLKVVLWKDGAQMGPNYSYPLSQGEDWTLEPAFLNAAGTLAGHASRTRVTATYPYLEFGDSTFTCTAGEPPSFSHDYWDRPLLDTFGIWANGLTSTGSVWGYKTSYENSTANQLAHGWSSFIGATYFASPEAPDGLAFDPLLVNATGAALGLLDGTPARYSGGTPQTLPAQALLALSDNGTVVGLNTWQPLLPDLPANALAAFLAPVTTGQKTDLTSLLPAEFRKQIAFDSNTTAQINSTGDILFHTLTLEGPEDAPAWHGQAILWTRQTSPTHPHGTLAQVPNPGQQLNHDRLMVAISTVQPPAPEVGPPAPSYQAAKLLLPLEFIAVDSLGNPAEAAATLKYSLPSPVLETQSPVIGTPTADGSGNLVASITLSGTIKSDLCDTLPGADGSIETATLYVNGSGDGITVPVTINKGTGATLGKPFPFTGTFSAVIPNVQLTPGRNTLRLEAKDKIHHIAGYSFWEVTVAGGPADDNEDGFSQPASGNPTLISVNMALPSVPLSLTTPNQIQCSVNGTSPAAALTETGLRTGVFVNNDGTLMVELTGLSKLRADRRNPLTAIITAPALGLDHAVLHLAQTTRGSLDFGGASRVITPGGGGTGGGSLAAAAPEAFYVAGTSLVEESIGGEFHPFMVRVRAPAGLSGQLRLRMGTPQPGGGGTFTSTFNTFPGADGMLYLKRDDANAPAVFTMRPRFAIPDHVDDAAFLEALKTLLGGGTLGDSYEFGKGFVAGMGAGGWEMVTGTAKLAWGGTNYIAHGLIIAGCEIAITVGSAVGANTETPMLWALEMQAEQAEVHAGLGKVLGPLVAFARQSSENQAQVILALLTGDSELLKGVTHEVSAMHLKILQLGGELIAAELRHIGDERDPRKQGYLVGRAVFEVASVLVPLAKSGQLAKLGKLEFLQKIAAESKFFRAGGPGAPALEEVQPLMQRLERVAQLEREGETSLETVEDVIVALEKTAGQTGDAAKRKRFANLITALGKKEFTTAEEANKAFNAIFQGESTMALEDFAGMLAGKTVIPELQAILADYPTVKYLKARCFKDFGVKRQYVTEVHHIPPEALVQNLKDANLLPAGFDVDAVPGHAMEYAAHRTITDPMNGLMATVPYKALSARDKLNAIIQFYVDFATAQGPASDVGKACGNMAEILRAWEKASLLPP